jgi:hypothetical protein
MIIECLLNPGHLNSMEKIGLLVRVAEERHQKRRSIISSNLQQCWKLK